MPPAKRKVRRWLYNLLVRKAPRLLAWLKRIRRSRKRRHILSETARSRPATRDSISADLRRAGIKPGDLLIVHSSLSAMGYVEGGAEAVVDALLGVLGPEGTLVMPAFAHDTFSKYYLDNDPVFDIVRSPSKAGRITEVFRNRPGVIRSFHPTDAVCAAGPLAHWLTCDHFGQITPYNQKSPYCRIGEKQGKILCIGVPLLTSCTNLHTLEDAVDFKYPVYHRRVYDVKMRDASGHLHSMKTQVHDPAWSRKRRPDDLVPLFEREGILKHAAVARASSFLIDAAALFRVMKKHYFESGVTMYTPFGE